MVGEGVAHPLHNDSKFENKLRLFSAFPRSAIIKEIKAWRETDKKRGAVMLPFSIFYLVEAHHCTNIGMLAQRCV